MICHRCGVILESEDEVRVKGVVLCPDCVDDIENTVPVDIEPDSDQRQHGVGYPA